MALSEYYYPPVEDAAALEASHKRLSLLLRHAEQVWVMAVFENALVRKAEIERLRQSLAPIEVLEVSLLGENRNPLLHLENLSQQPHPQPPVVNFVNVGSAMPDVFGYVDIQREAIALQPYRLVLWVTPGELSEMARRAPNFYSRISGVFYFTGRSQNQPILATERTSSPTVSDKRWEQRIENLRRRIEELQQLKPIDPLLIALEYEQIAQIYSQTVPPLWLEAKAAYCTAAQHYAQASQAESQAEALWQAGYAAFRGYEYARASDLYQQALELYRAVGSRLGEASTLQAIGEVQQFRAENDAALQSYAQALELFRAVGDRLGEASTLKAIGDVQQFRDEYDAALESYAQALELFRAVGDRLGEASTLQAMGDVQQFRKENDAALQSYAQALELFRAVGSRLGEANTLSGLGQIELIIGNKEKADEYLGRSVEIYKRIGDRYSVPAQIGNFGWAALRAGKPSLAKPYLLEAAKLFEDMGWTDYAERHRRAANR